MPDLISHAIIGFLICELLNLRPKSLVVLGAVMPDLLLKWELLHTIFPIGDRLYWFLMPLHTPVGLLLATFIIIHFFNYSKGKTFLLITSGWLSHILSDLIFNKHFYDGNFLLFPFSWVSFEIGMVWAEEFYLVLIPLLIIYIIVKITKSIAFKELVT